MLDQILSKHLNEYAIVKRQGFAYILFAKAYIPYDNVRSDAYYPASNELYFVTRQIINELNQIGIAADRRASEYLKPLAFEGGLSQAQGLNTLTYRNDCGSRFALSVIKVVGDFNQKHLDYAKIKMPCASCRRCERACPTGAISIDGFCAQRCLRYIQSGSGIIDDDELAQKFGGRVFGCDICQRVCPLNSNQTARMPDEFDLGFDELLKTGSTTMLQKYLGTNYAKFEGLKNFVIIAAGNTQRTDLAPYIEALVDDELCGTNAKRTLKQLKTCPPK